jgi:putative phosphoesterase
MKIGIIADTHDHMGKIQKALRIFKRKNVEAILHCGDFVAPFALRPFKETKIQFIGVFGNNDGEKEGLKNFMDTFGTIHHPPYTFTLAKKNFLLSHYPLDGENLRQSHNKYDYICFGHTHKVAHEKMNTTLMMNPGEACGWLYGTASIGLLDTETNRFNTMEI